MVQLGYIFHWNLIPRKLCFITFRGLQGKARKAHTGRRTIYSEKDGCPLRVSVLMSSGDEQFLELFMSTEV